MSDISKCAGESCKDRDTCFRFTAKADPIWQSYMEPDRTATECRSYWPLTTIATAKNGTMKPRDFCNCAECNPKAWEKWKSGKCVPVHGESVGSTECLHCERILTSESDPEMDCPKYRKPTPSPVPPHKGTP